MIAHFITNNENMVKVTSFALMVFNINFNMTSLKNF